MSGLDEEFARYFEAMDRARGQDRCYLCRRTSAEVKAFFGFDEDGHPSHASEFGIEDVVLEQTDIMSYRGKRPVCAVCQLNVEMVVILNEQDLFREVLREMRDEREKLWPSDPAGAESPASDPPEEPPTRPPKGSPSGPDDGP